MIDTIYIGQNLQRTDGVSKVKGDPIYANDMNLPGQLYLKALRSKVAHARLISINTEAASKIPGIIRIFTAKDVSGINRVGRIKKDQPVLVDEKVRMVGDALALVAAVSIEAAEQALELIEVKLENLEAVFDPELALKEGAPQVHTDGNRVFKMDVTRGNIEEAFAQADVVIENTYETARNDHAYMEPEAALGYVDEEGRVTIMSPHQHPHQLQGEIATVLGVDRNQVRIIHTATGGGFGGKIDVCLEGLIAVAVHHLRQPVKMWLTRPESLAITSKRLPFKIHYCTAARKDGKILGVKIDMISDNGAYAYSGSSVMRRAVTHAAGPYEVANLSIKAATVYTNNPIGGQMRGFGVTEIAVAHEAQMDAIAHALGIDPLEIRMSNALRDGCETITGQKLTHSVGLLKCLEEVSKRKPILEAHPTPPGKLKGIGVAAMYYGIGKTGVSVPSTVRAKYDGATATIYSGAAEIGQGLNTALKQIAADSFVLPLEAVTLVMADTACTPDSGPSSASCQTYMTGNAIKMVAEKLRKRLASGETGMLEDQCTYTAQTTAVDIKTGYGEPYESYAFAAHLVEVYVDPKTGQVEVPYTIAANDVGKAINPILVEGQIEGGVVMGVGCGLMEDYVVGRSNSLHEYIIPSILDSPEITSIIVEDKHELGPFGAKGVGEPSMVPTAPAILNAIYNATGVRVNCVPCTPERLYFAMKAKNIL